ncbi:Uncharacterised protein [Mycobacteroides abscessus subsp. abscessus]|nr:Uncharacterised protein [Mycobacteroides abscessus subsp. abscessus]
MRKHTRQATTNGKGLRMRAANGGIASVPTNPTAEKSATITPPNLALPPAEARIAGIQVNIEYVTSDVIPNMPAMPHASGERQTCPTAAESACGSALWSSTSWPRRAITTPIHGSRAATGTSTQATRENRHP